MTPDTPREEQVRMDEQALSAALITDADVTRALMPFVAGRHGDVKAGLLRELSLASAKVGARFAALPAAVPPSGGSEGEAVAVIDALDRLFLVVREQEAKLRETAGPQATYSLVYLSADENGPALNFNAEWLHDAAATLRRLYASPVSPALVGDEADAELQRQEAEAANGALDRIADILGVDRHERRIVLIEAVRRLAERPAPRLAEVERLLNRLRAAIDPKDDDYAEPLIQQLLALLGPAGGAAHEPATDATAMRRFTVYRRGDLSATHNDQQVAPADQPQYEGVVFTDGRVALRWLTPLRSTSCWDSLDDALGVHGHPEPRYGTELVWHDTALSGAVPAHGAGETK